MALEVNYIHETGDKALLEQAMEQVFNQAWPEYIGLETADNFMRMVNDPPRGYKPFIMVAGENLDDPDPDKRKIYGFRYGVYFDKSQTAMAIYLAVTPEQQKKGIGHFMMKKTVDGFRKLAYENGGLLQGVFFEINDPKKVRADEDTMPPKTRKRIFERWGAKQIFGSREYIQPLFEGLQKQVDKFLLMVYGAPSIQAVRGFLFDFYHFYGEMNLCDIRQNTAYHTMMRTLDRKGLHIDRPPSLGEQFQSLIEQTIGRLKTRRVRSAKAPAAKGPPTQ